MLRSVRYIFVFAIILFLFLAGGARAYQEECYVNENDVIICPGDDTGGDDTGGDDGGDGDSGSGETGGSSGRSGQQSEPWSGYSDGRLNPDPGEYYSLWCAFDRLEIWRAVPETQLIKMVGIGDIVALNVGAALDLGDFMTLVRNTSDTITIYGSNGNSAPEPGSKAFSLSECIARNGGLPETDDDSPATGDDGNSPPDDDPQARRREAEATLDFCFDGYEFLRDSWLLAGCLNNALSNYRDVLNGDEIASLAVMIFCLNVVVGNGIVPIGIILFLSWHRRWLSRQKTIY